MSRSPGRCFSPLMSLTMVTGAWWFSVLLEFEHTGLHSVRPPSMPRVNSNWESFSRLEVYGWMIELQARMRELLGRMRELHAYSL